MMVRMKTGDQLMMNTPSGGGRGPPLEANGVNGIGGDHVQTRGFQRRAQGAMDLWESRQADL